VATRRLTQINSRSTFWRGFVLPLGCCATLTLSACVPGALTETRELKRADADFISLPAGRRVAIAQNRDTKEIVCLAPSPDYAQATGFVLSGAGDSAGEANNDLSLGGRSSNVLIAREVLYYTCSMIARYSRSTDEAKEMFYKGLETVKDVAVSDKTPGTGIASSNSSTQLSDSTSQGNTTGQMEVDSSGTSSDSESTKVNNSSTGGW
jgi:hypothetical protein